MPPKRISCAPEPGPFPPRLFGLGAPPCAAQERAKSRVVRPLHRGGGGECGGESGGESGGGEGGGGEGGGAGDGGGGEGGGEQIARSAGQPMQAAPPTLDVYEWYPGDPPHAATVLGAAIQ